VGLVNAQKHWPRTFEEARGCQRLERFRRCEDDQTTTLFEPFKRGAALGHAQAAVQRDDGHAAAPQRAFLVGHQRNER
jgi:hypothetical protein